MRAHREELRAVVVGEVLFDCLPHGARTLGGAPFNVARHLRGLGLDPLFVSRVGDDEAGRAIRASMEAWGMDTAGLQVDPSHPTGAVDVDLDGDGVPRFEIRPDQAYDFIDVEEARAAVAGCSSVILHHGTLVTRSASAWEAVASLRKAWPRTIMVDVNLRPPWTGPAEGIAALEGARWAKLGRDELSAILDVEIRDLDEVSHYACSLANDLALEGLLVTLGAEGALFVGVEAVIHCSAASGVAVADTVGAGDGATAVFLTGLLSGWPEDVLLRRSRELCSALCGIRGAQPADESFYEPFRRAWAE